MCKNDVEVKNLVFKKYKTKPTIKIRLYFENAPIFLLQIDS